MSLSRSQYSVIRRKKKIKRTFINAKKRLKVSVPRLELGISRVLGERHDQLDHTDLLKIKINTCAIRIIIDRNEHLINAPW